MEKRLALTGIIVEDKGSVAELNSLLAAYGEHIVGRMGLPMRERGVSFISVVIDAEADIINAMTGKIGNLSGVKAKTIFTAK